MSGHSQRRKLGFRQLASGRRFKGAVRLRPVEVGRLSTQWECSIVVLNWNKRDRLRRSLATLHDVSAPASRFEVIAVDNGSTDGSQEMVRHEFPDVRLIENGRNLGAAQGRNVGLRAARGGFVLFLDDSTAIYPNQVDALIKAAKAHPQAGIVTGMKVDSAGKPLYTHHVPSPTTLGLTFSVVTELSLIEIGRAIRRWVKWGAAIPHESREVVEIPYVGGGLMLVRMEAIREVGPWDENFFIYGEDFDLCYRFRKQGWKILYLPQLRVLAGFGINAVRTKRASLLALRSRLHLFEKYVGKRYLPVYVAVATAGLLPKLTFYALLALQNPRCVRAEDISTWEWLREYVRILWGRGSAVPIAPEVGVRHDA